MHARIGGGADTVFPSFFGSSGEARQTAEDVERMRGMIAKLERARTGKPTGRMSRIEAKLVKCARAAIVDVDRSAETSKEKWDNCIDSAQASTWLGALEALRLDEQNSVHPSTAMLAPTAVSVVGKHTLMTSPRASTTAKPSVAIPEHTHCEDDFDLDLARAALETGTSAFSTQAWEEATSLLQEALSALLQLSPEQRAFADIFALHYRLAVCAYYTHEPADAEHALLSLDQLMPSTDEQRSCVYHSKHLLAQLYIRTQQIELAQVQCEKALQGRRRVCGKLSVEALESLALMAHVYVLLGNRARAKSCLAMMPEAQRNGVLQSVEAELQGVVSHLDFASVLTQGIGKDSSEVVEREWERVSLGSDGDSVASRGGNGRGLASPLGVYRQGRVREAADGTEKLPSRSQSPFETVSSSPKTPQSNLVHQAVLEDDPPSWSTPTRTSISSYPLHATTPSIKHSDNICPEPQTRLPRTEILRRIGCQPRDKLEQAVCTSDHALLNVHLRKRKNIWRASLRPRGAPERITALHYAALFGEVNMARRLVVEGNFNVDEIPFGYSTRLTPLHFAMGARQVGMVEMLLAHGARPVEGESWTSLAKMMLSRAWIAKTMSEAERGDAPQCIAAILAVLVRFGWDVDLPEGKDGENMLHAAVSFYSGDYEWDARLKVAICKVLCVHGADSHVRNKHGKTAFDIAAASGQKELIEVLVKK